MRTLYLLSVWLHILAAAVWIGGMLFLALVLVPALRRPTYRGTAQRLIYETGLRFRAVGWTALALLVLSGVFNLTFRGYTWDDLWAGGLWQGPFGRTLALKLVLVAFILALTALHDFVLGPRASARLMEDPDSPEARRLRLRASWIGRLNLLLSLLVLALAVALVRGGL